MNLIVSTHAVQRLRERFFNYFPVSCFYTKADSRALITAQMKHAVKLREWKMVPFYVNMMGWKHGPNIEVYYRAPVFYFVEETADRMCVVTVTKNFRKNEKKK